MPRIGNVWDSTTDVLAGRAGQIAWIAALGVFVPVAVQNALRIFGGATPGMAALGALAGLAALVASLWTQLAVIAVASDPAMTGAAAGRVALARLPANLLVVVVLGGAAVLLVLPILLALAAAGFDFAAAAATGGADPPTLSPGVGLFLLLYGLALTALFLWAAARLFLVNAVVLNERRAIGALGRSLALTRGLTAKLIGVVLLFGVTLLIVSAAAGAGIGLMVRLALGSGQLAVAQYMAALARAAVQAAFVAIVQVFAARLYAATTVAGAPTA